MQDTPYSTYAASPAKLSSGQSVADRVSFCWRWRWSRWITTDHHYQLDSLLFPVIPGVEEGTYRFADAVVGLLFFRRPWAMVAVLCVGCILRKVASFGCYWVFGLWPVDWGLRLRLRLRLLCRGVCCGFGCLGKFLIGLSSRVGIVGPSAGLFWIVYEHDRVQWTVIAADIFKNFILLVETSTEQANIQT